MGIIAIAGARLFIRVTTVPQKMLAPIIVTLCIMGAYAINNSIADVWVMVVFGLTLGSIAEQGLRQSIDLAQGDVIGYYLSRPISVALIILILLSVLSPLLVRYFKNRGSQPQRGEQ
jgi:putative tricarboxylic transport membrane protein